MAKIIKDLTESKSVKELVAKRKNKDESQLEEKNTCLNHAEIEYRVLQVVLKEKFIGVGSNAQSMSLLEATINEQAKNGWKLHTISTTSSGSKGFGGGDRIQATMVFEKVNKK